MILNRHKDRDQNNPLNKPPRPHVVITLLTSNKYLFYY